MHQNRHGQLAVVGVMVERGTSENAALAVMERHAPDHGHDAFFSQVRIDARNLLPQSLAHFRYVGSLTTPPCSEGVAWHVLQQPIRTSAGNIRALASRMPYQNARPLQALYGRRLTLD